MEPNLERFKGQYLKETEKKPKVKPKGYVLKGYGSPGKNWTIRDNRLRELEKQ